MKGTTNAQRNAVVSSTYSGNTLKLTYADGKSDSHTLAAPVTVDSALSSTSMNPVQNKVINKALEGYVPTETGKGLSTNDYTDPEKTKVSNLPDNANLTFATKSELTNAVSSVYKYKGTVATHANLPSSGNTTGDVWNVTASHGNVPAGTNWAWNGSAWDALGGEIDLSGYVPTSRKVNGKALSGDITLAASDVSAVPTTRKVNNKALSADITLTAGDVGALATNGTAAKATADASGNNIVNTYATKTELTNGLAGKQNALTFDSAPTSGSSNPVTSGGVYSAINGKQDKLTFDTTPTSGSSNPITSGGVYTAIKTELENFVPGYMIKISTDTDWVSASTYKSTGSGGYVYNIVSLPESIKSSGNTNNSGASSINLRTTGGDWSEYSQSNTTYISSSNAGTASITDFIIKRWVDGWIVESNYVGSLTLVLDIAVVFRMTQSDGSIVYTSATASGISFKVNFETNSATFSGSFDDIDTGKTIPKNFPYAKVYITDIVSIS